MNDKIQNIFTDGSDPISLKGDEYEKGMAIMRDRCPIFLAKYAGKYLHFTKSDKIRLNRGKNKF